MILAYCYVLGIVAVGHDFGKRIKLPGSSLLACSDFPGGTKAITSLEHSDMKDIFDWKSGCAWDNTGNTFSSVVFLVWCLGFQFVFLAWKSSGIYAIAILKKKNRQINSSFKFFYFKGENLWKYLSRKKLIIIFCLNCLSYKEIHSYFYMFPILNRDWICFEYLYEFLQINIFHFKRWISCWYNSTITS